MKYKVRFRLICRDHITEATCSGPLSKEEVADSIIDIYKVQVDALKTVSHLDHMNSPANILIGMGVTGEDEVKAIS